jgi:hypothetical protein
MIHQTHAHKEIQWNNLYKYCIRIHSLSRRWVIVTILIRLILNIIYVAPIISPSQHSPQTPFAIDIGLLFSLISEYEAHIPYVVTLTSYFAFRPLTHDPAWNTAYPITVLLLKKLILKFMFKVVTRCIPSLGGPYCGLFILFHYSPLPLYLPCPHFSRALITHSSFLFFTCYGMQC